MRWRKFPIVVFGPILVAGIVGCSSGQASTGQVTGVMQSPITKTVLDVTKSGLIVVAGDSDNPVISGIALAGIYAIDLLQSQVAQVHAADPAATLLVITHTVNGKQEVSIYKITTEREVKVTMNGKFVEEITPYEITITAQPGTNSTIVVTDANADERIYREGTITLLEDHSKYSRANLDTGASVSVPSDQAEIIFGFAGKVSAVNGTTVTLWQGPGQPSLNACSSLPQQQWSTQVVGYRLTPVQVGTEWCVHTGAGHYGVILVDGDLIGFKLSYVLWVKQ
jgi:hypothetical protein